MTAAVGIGVAGLGRMGRIHAENLAHRVPAARLVHVADEAPDRAQLLGDDLGVAWSTSFDDLLADEAVEAVVIATPTPLHAQMTELAASAGRHIYCEKPLALDLETTGQVVEVARGAGVQLQIGFHRRFDPDLALVHERVHGGELGDISLFKATFREMAPPTAAYLRECGGIFVDTVIHDLDVAQWLVGDITEITAISAHQRDGAASAADGLSAALILRFANGALGIIDNTRIGGYGYESAIEIVGSQATVRTGHGQGRDEVQRLAAGHLTRALPLEFHERFDDAYRLALAGFIDALLTGQPVSPSGEDAIAALHLAHAAARSAAERRTVRPALHTLTAR